jgi:hypothetical protein
VIGDPGGDGSQVQQIPLFGDCGNIEENERAHQLNEPGKARRPRRGRSVAPPTVETFLMTRDQRENKVAAPFGGPAAERAGKRGYEA